MRKLNYIIIISLFLMVNGCESGFLDVAPFASLDHKTLSTSEGAEKLLLGAYSVLDCVGGSGQGNGISGSNWVFGGVASDDAYKGSTPGDLANISQIENYTADASNSLFNSKWRISYDGVQRSNDVIRVLDDVKDMTEQRKIVVLAEARFLRGHYHFELKRMFNMVPYIDETITYAAGNINKPNDKDIWPDIEADFAFAAENLPEVQQDKGRANKWAAKSYLAKALIYQNKFTEAKPLLEDVINNGVTASGVRYALINYGDNFNPEFNNNSEDVFAIQMSVNDNANGYNGNRGDRLNGPFNGGPIAAGFYQPSQSLVNSYRVDENGLPYLDAFNEVDVKNDQGLGSTEPFEPDQTSLDPRLDWTVGRRGIPYHDWGLHPGNAWVRDQYNGGPYAPLKTIPQKQHVGIYTDASAQFGLYTSINFTLIRFSDVILMAAEAEAEAGSLSKATELVNRVRTRAADPNGWRYEYIDNDAPELGFSNVPAANYKVGLYTTFASKEYARKAIQFERKLELAMEGHRFFDLVRYGTADAVLNSYIAKEKNHRNYFSNSSFIKGKHEYFPIPQAQIDLSGGKLIQNPAY